MDVSPAGSGDIMSQQFYTYNDLPGGYPENFSETSTYTLMAMPNTDEGYVFSYWEVKTITTTCTGETVKTDIYTQNPLTVSILEQGKYVTAYFLKLSESPSLFFPHISTKSSWETEICVINTNADKNMLGTLRAYADSGEPIDTKSISLYPHGRRELKISDWFANPDSIGHIDFHADVDGAVGYTKFYQDGKFRTAIPASKEANTSDIYVPHIASNDTFWTGISLVNSTSLTKKLTFLFNDGRQGSVSLNPNEHKAFTIASMFGGTPQPTIKSATITNASGIVGLELFGTSTQLDGIVLSDDTTITIYYPHVANMASWWTGIVAYNPSTATNQLTITPFSEEGNMLAGSTISIAAKDKYIGLVRNLNLPDQTAWFRITATQPLVGFELFSTLDGKQLAAYAEGNGGGSKQGVFPKIDQDGWTGVAFVNTEGYPANVTLTAYRNDGLNVATATIRVNGHAKVVKMAENIFSNSNISIASYIGFTSDRRVVGFQLNGSSDGKMLDGIPALY